MKKLSELKFSPSYATLPDAFHTHPGRAEFPEPYLIDVSPEAAALIGLDPNEANTVAFSKIFTGQAVMEGMDPIATLYSGHQFGNYKPQLGDGRALTLGELEHEGKHWEVQLKGAGPTSFSRDGDGRAVLRSSIREYLCSEAMHGLGVPTTRALAIQGSDMEVYRERIETAAIVIRLAPSHVRFGNFEVFYHRSQHEELKTLADYVIAHDFPELNDGPDKYLKFFEGVVRRTANLIAQWQSVGFEHGVMNTDNMSALGLTMDYGPFGFMEAFDPDWVVNHSDHQGRYSYSNQPRVAHWNLACFAQTILPLVGESGTSALQAVFNGFNDLYTQKYDEIMAKKLGINAIGEPSRELVEQLLEIMAEVGADFTNTFRALGVEDIRQSEKLNETFKEVAKYSEWSDKYSALLAEEGIDNDIRIAKQNSVNPVYVLRNYLAQQAIEKAEQKDFSEVNRLRRALSAPYTVQEEFLYLSEPPPEWAKGLALSCSS